MERTARQDRMVMEDYEAHIYSHVDTPQVTLHYHADFFEIYCLLEGSVLYQVERRQYALTPGSLLILPPGTLHWPAHIDASKPYRRMFLWIQQDDLRRLSTAQTDLSLGLLPPYSEQMLLLSLSELNDLQSSIRQLIALGDCRSYGQDIQRHALLSTILLSVNTLSLHGQERAKASLPPKSLIEQAFDYIDQQLHTSLRTEDIASSLLVSKSYLEKQFYKHLGVSIHRYIVQRRMQRAQQLIENKTPAALAAQQVGYLDYSAFYRAFLKAHGVPPTTLKARAAISDSSVGTAGASSHNSA